ncbi:hypothetical protein ACKWTF_000723 [Chironomus riparius]
MNGTSNNNLTAHTQINMHMFVELKLIKPAKNKSKFQKNKSESAHRPPVSATSPDMSHGYAFMQHFTDISIFFTPTKKKRSAIYEHKQHESEKMKSFLEPLRQFFTFYSSTHT